METAGSYFSTDSTREQPLKDAFLQSAVQVSHSLRQQRDLRVYRASGRRNVLPHIMRK